MSDLTLTAPPASAHASFPVPAAHGALRSDDRPTRLEWAPYERGLAIARVTTIALPGPTTLELAFYERSLELTGGTMLELAGGTRLQLTGATLLELALRDTTVSTEYERQLTFG